MIALAQGVLFRKTGPLYWRAKASSLLLSLSLGSTTYQRWFVSLMIKDNINGNLGSDDGIDGQFIGVDQLPKIGTT